MPRKQATAPTFTNNWGETVRPNWTESPRVAKERKAAEQIKREADLHKGPSQEGDFIGPVALWILATGVIAAVASFSADAPKTKLIAATCATYLFPLAIGVGVCEVIYLLRSRLVK